MTIRCVVAWSADKTVNIQTLSKQFKYEITANPKKVIFLGILAALGLYFWIPLLCGWVNKDKEGSESPIETQTAANASSEQASSVDSLTANKEEKTERHSWKEVLKQMSNDPRTRPVESIAVVRDPFQGSKDSIAKTMAEDTAAEKPPSASPASLGMILTSTLIGPQGAIARIGGRTYNQGQTIKAEKEGHSYKFILTEINDRQVTLEAEGERFQLIIPEPTDSSRMVLETVENKTGR